MRVSYSHTKEQRGARGFSLWRIEHWGIPLIPNISNIMTWPWWVLQACRNIRKSVCYSSLWIRQQCYESGQATQDLSSLVDICRQMETRETCLQPYKIPLESRRSTYWSMVLMVQVRTMDLPITSVWGMPEGSSLIGFQPIAGSQLHKSSPRACQRVHLLKCFVCQGTKICQEMWLRLTLTSHCFSWVKGKIRGYDGNTRQVRESVEFLAALRSAEHSCPRRALQPNPGIHLSASVDHVNAPLLWDKRTAAHFSWVFEELTTFVPYMHETNGIKALLCSARCTSLCRHMPRQGWCWDHDAPSCRPRVGPGSWGQVHASQCIRNACLDIPTNQLRVHIAVFGMSMLRRGNWCSA